MFTISILYAYCRVQYIRIRFLILNEAVAVNPINKFVLDNTVTSTSVPTGAIYAVERSHAAQADEAVNSPKSLYNLGAYDTYVDNGDGTVTVTRKTGYLNASDMTWNYSNAITGFISTDGGDLVKVTGFQTTPNISANIKVVPRNQIASTDNSISANAAEEGGSNTFLLKISSTVTTTNDLMSWLSANPVYIQYETTGSYTEKLPANTPINTLDANMSNIVREEVEKTLNLYNHNDVSGFSGNVDASDFGEGTIDVAWVGVSSNATINFNAKNGATFSCRLNSASAGYWAYNMTWLYQDGTSERMTTNQSVGTSGNFTFSSAAKEVIGIQILVNLNWSASNVMINEGSHAYPYQPYNGAIVHEKQLNEALEDGAGAINGTDVPENGDLNNCFIENGQGRVYGWYHAGITSSNTIANTPYPGNFNTGFYLLVLQTSMKQISSNSRLFQVLYGVCGTYKGKIFIRSYDSSDGSGSLWMPWKKLATEDDLQNYLPLTGGTINGNVNIQGNFSVYPTNATPVTIDGTINATGQVQEAGQRVYSPNNPPPGISPRYMHHALIRVSGAQNTSWRVSITSSFSVSFVTMDTGYYILLDLETGSNSAFESMTDVYNALLGIRKIGFISVNQTFSAGQGPCEIAFTTPTIGAVSAIFPEAMQSSALMFRVVYMPNTSIEFVNDDVETINN